MTDTTSRPPADADAALWNVVQGVELVDVRVVRWHSVLLDYHAQTVEDLDPVFSVDFRSDTETMQFRWVFDTTLKSVTGKPVADLGLTLLQTFEFRNSDVSLSFSDSLMHEFTEKTAIISIMPFVREAVQTMTVRLGLPAVTIGLMRAGSAGPQSFSVRGEGA
jgi:hypothetical protein